MDTKLLIANKDHQSKRAVMGAKSHNHYICNFAASKRPCKGQKFLCYPPNFVSSHLSSYLLAMSSLSRYLIICGLLPTFVYSLPLNSPQTADDLLTLANPSSLPASLNVSTGTNSSTIVNDLLQNQTSAPLLKYAKVECDERLFGSPPVASCRNAFAQIPQDPAMVISDRTLSYGPRGKGTWDVNLPKRYISCELLQMSETSQR